MKRKLLEVNNVVKNFPITKGLIFSKKVADVKAVEGISFVVYEGDIFGIVGESGCGKTTTSQMILLLESISEGEIIFNGKNISDFSGDELKEYHKSVQAMFQDPYDSINPRMKISDVIAEPIEANLVMSKAEVKNRVKEILNEVKLDPSSAGLFPHEFSGGQLQRIALARSLAINPELVILDEPVSALDVSIRAQLMNLLMEIHQKKGLTYIIIAHDLAVIRHMCNRVAVMYLGNIVEYGDTEAVYTAHYHPYTRTLLSATLPFTPEAFSQNSKVHEVLELGEVPSPVNPPSGCHFNPRCIYAREICREKKPDLRKAEGDHWVACHLFGQI